MDLNRKHLKEPFHEYFNTKIYVSYFNSCSKIVGTRSQKYIEKKKISFDKLVRLSLYFKVKSKNFYSSRQYPSSPVPACLLAKISQILNSTLSHRHIIALLFVPLRTFFILSNLCICFLFRTQDWRRLTVFGPFKYF